MTKPSFIFDDFCLAPRQPVVRMALIGCNKILVLAVSPPRCRMVVTNPYCRVFEYGADSDKASDHWEPRRS